MRYFPVFMDLKDQDVLVVGGGAVAERKVRLLLKAGARVHIAAKALSENLHYLLQRESLEWVSSEYRPPLLEGKRLVFAATSDEKLNRRIWRDAEAELIPVNVVDDRDHCRFISPAVVDRSPVQVAISTGGAAPVLARRLRTWIERLLPAGLGRVAEAAGGLRSAAAEQVEPGERRRFWESILRDDKLVRWSSLTTADIVTAMKNSFARHRNRRGQGFVYLVGAGPGNPDLLTLRALQVLGNADVVLHDRLVSEEILDLARRDADRVYVGKRAGNHHRRQEEIHRIMRDEAARGRTVVRLKGGDPFVFGRGGEELEALADAGIPCEVVPGITAAIGCAAYAGIPLTHRDHAQALSFVTGRLSPAGRSGQAPVDWASVAGEGRTAVVYMGVGQAETLRTQMIASGISAHLPVALIEDGSRGNQRVLRGTVATLPALAGRSRPGRPSLLIVGQVAGLADRLGWFAGTDAGCQAA